MPESRNVTLMELSGRYAAGGAASVIQRYPDTKHFLVVPPVGSEQPPLLWTSQNSMLSGTTELCQKDREKMLSAYADPRTVITPIEKRGRNEDVGITVGRDTDADIRLKDTGVSKRHARIKFKGDKILLRDLGSTNGTFINQCRMMPDSIYHVTPGQEVKFGETRTAYLNLEHLLDLVILTTER
jgi:hypothetical protein